tara:strand:- start:733 stop:969 length:237 start_codon:yes stop_codon:yes gene_type:complete
MKKKELTYNYICEEIELARIMLDEIHNYHIKHSNINTISAFLEARKSAKYKYYLEELHPLIVVYKTRHQNKFIAFPKF